MTATLISPSLINLYTKLSAYSQAVLPLLADELGVSIPKTARLFDDSLVISVLCAMDETQSLLSPPNATNHSTSHHTQNSHQLITTHPKLRQWLDYGIFDTQSFGYLATQPNPIAPTQLALAKNYLAGYHHISPPLAERCLHLVALLTHHYIDSACADRQLSQQERAIWLNMQAYFISHQDGYPNSDTLLAQLNINLRPPANHHSNYQHKLNPKAVMFNQSDYPIANHRWLIELALALNDKPSLTIGACAIKAPRTRRANFLSKLFVSKRFLSKRFLIVAVAVKCLLFLMIAVLLYRSISSPDTASDNTPAPTKPIVIQDVAIIRTDSDITNDDTNTNNDKSNSDTSNQSTTQSPKP